MVKCTNKKNGIKTSKYTGVYKCKGSNFYFSKNIRNKRIFLSKLYKSIVDAAKSYDKFKLKYDKNPKNLNFPLKKQKKLLNIKKNISKRPRILEYIKIIIYSKQNEKCILCNNNLGVGRIIDHIIPRYLGGLDNINNYQALCGVCNKWKTYSLDHKIKDYMKKKCKKIHLTDILKLQKKEYIKFNGPYK
jgi:5-methylcytosine-specific restriction endonuclease McrA